MATDRFFIAGILSELIANEAFRQQFLGSFPEHKVAISALSDGKAFNELGIAQDCYKNLREVLTLDIINLRLWIDGKTDGEQLALRAEQEIKARGERLQGLLKVEPIVLGKKIGGGVGTELKKLLAKIGIVATPNCKCNARARLMDQNGVEWCKTNRELIVDWLAEEAAARKLPFVRAAGKLLVKRAIHNAMKNSNQI